jgi:hypothetical protein
MLPPLGWWNRLLPRATVVFGTTLALGTAVLELCGHKREALSEISETAYRRLLLGAAVVTKVSLLALVLVGLLAALVGLVRWRRRGRRLGLVGAYDCRLANGPDLAQLWSFWRGEFGDEIPSFEIMKAWHARNHSLFWMLHEPADPEDPDRRPVLVGSFSLLPIYAGAEKALERESAEPGDGRHCAANGKAFGNLHRRHLGSQEGAWRDGRSP